jgi:hypothetical protein
MNLKPLLSKSWLKNTFRMALLAVAFYYIIAYFKNVDLSMLLRPSWLRLAEASVLVLAAYAVQGIIWITATGEKGARVVQSLAVFYSSNIFKYIPGKIWQFAFVAAEGRKSENSVRYAKGLFYLNALSVLFGLSLFWVYFYLHTLQVHYLFGFALTTLIVAISLQFVDFESFLRKLPLSFLRTDGEAVRGAYGLIYLELAGYIALFSLAMALVSFKKVDLSAFLGASLLFIGWALGSLAFILPQGIGVREAAMVWLLNGLINKEVMMQLIVFFRLFPLLLEILLFAISYSYLARTRRNP